MDNLLSLSVIENVGEIMNALSLLDERQKTYDYARKPAPNLDLGLLWPFELAQIVVCCTCPHIHKSNAARNPNAVVSRVCPLPLPKVNVPSSSLLMLFYPFIVVDVCSTGFWQVSLFMS
jgi:hypothetical protein